MKLPAVPALLCTLMAAGCAADVPPPAERAHVPPDLRMVSVDYRELVSRADLTFNEPVPRPESGLPVGNGRIGSLVWTAPTALKLQVNHADVFAASGSTRSFTRRHADYCNGCGIVDVDFAEEVFPGAGMTSDRTIQHLSAYDALASVEGKGVAAKVLAWHERDVMAIECRDRRRRPGPVGIVLKMLRPPQVKTFDHTAGSRFVVRDGKIVLVQEFSEGKYFCTSAVAIAVTGRAARAVPIDEMTMRLDAAAGKGTFTILIACAASFDRNEDVVAAALRQLDAAAGLGFAGLLKANQAFWHDFWRKSFVHAHSDDGLADMVSEYYTYYLYVMGSSSRGNYPPKFNDMIWSVRGDSRAWGAQYWWWNEQMLYRAPMGANHIELMAPLFNMYSSMYQASRTAARQQWGAEGIFITHVSPFDGLEELPEDLAKDLRDFMLDRKTLEQTSEAFQALSRRKHPQCGRWNWVGRGSGPYGPIVHTWNDGAKISWLYWQRYEYTLDKEFLRDRAYPMIKGMAEFYRTCPRVVKRDDGKYHVYKTNHSESIWGCQDPMDEMTGMKAMFTLAIQASEILGVDAGLRPPWRDRLENLAPFPVSDHPKAIWNPKWPRQPRCWTTGLLPAVKVPGYYGGMRPALHYDLWTLETPDPEMARIARNTFPYDWGYSNFHRGRPAHGCAETPITAAKLGLPEEVKLMLPIHTKMYGLLPNRMCAYEGVHSVERLGTCGYALQEALRQSVPPHTGGEHVIRVFPAWPRQWDATFRLLAGGGFLVASAMRTGRIEFVELLSQLGGPCRLRNPWPKQAVVLHRDGKAAKTLSGDLLTFDTRKGENLLVLPKGKSVRPPRPLPIP